MVTAIKEIILSLMDGIHPILKGVLVTIMVFAAITIGFIQYTGIDADSLRTARTVIEIKSHSILLDKRCKKYGYDVVDKSAEDLYIHNSCLGVAIFGAEPEMQARLLKVVARDGIKEITDLVKVGSSIDIDSQASQTWASMRASIHHSENLSEHQLVWRCGVKSIIAYPIEYQNAVVGTIIMFLDKKIEEYTEREMKINIGNMRNQAILISKEMYYSRD